MSAVPKPSELKAARTQLFAADGPRGVALRVRLVEVTDAWLARLFASVADGPGVALAAVGAYGRRDPAPGSDLDLVVLHRPGVDVAADAVWYPIWDTGVGLDHAVRTPEDVVDVARSDLKAALGLLDMRLVAGDTELVDQTRRSVLDAWRRESAKRLPEVHEQVRERERLNGELAFLLEPDLKESRGGLRDVHALRAAAAAWVTDLPGEEVRRAYERLLDVRGQLHLQTGRGSDKLVLQEQDGVAAALGYSDADALMRAVSAAGRTIAWAGDETWRRVLANTSTRRRWRRGGVPSESQRRPLADGVVEQGGEVVLARDADPLSDPVLAVRAAAAAAQHDLPLAAVTLDRLAAAPPIPEPWPDVARNALIALLGAGPPVVRVVEALEHAGLWGRWLPEWHYVRYRPQRNPVHRFTVDRHLVEAAAEAAGLARRVHRPDLLVLGALLHDIGKGQDGDHSVAGVELARAIATRWGLPPPDLDVVAALVRHHLLLPDTATRRDPDDPATVRLVCDAVGDRGTLQLLHALTEADGLATGPAAWNDWKAGLVADLVRRVSGVLDGAPPPAPAPLTTRQRQLIAGGELGLDVDVGTVTVVAPDRRGLLWRWAGVLALHRLDVRAATALTAGNPGEGSMAVSVLQVAPRFGSFPDWDLVRADLRHAYDGTLPLAERLAERERAYRRRDAHRVDPRVLFDDDASTSATVVEVRAHDEVGLLYRIARTLADEGLDVLSARVSTLGAEAVDAFYVVDGKGRRIDDDNVRMRIEQALLTALSLDPWSSHVGVTDL